MYKNILASLTGVLALLFVTACGAVLPASPATAVPDEVTTVIESSAATPEADPEPAGTEEATVENEPIADSELVIYSGRSEELVGPLIEQFEEASGLDVSVKYGDTTELASTILEEGENSPADVFFAQDAGALGALTNEGVLAALPQETVAMVDARFRAPDAEWVGVSARARVVVYNTEELDEAALPASILDFTAPDWRGRIGWAPTNASFQSFVTAMRASLGEEATRSWLEGIQANEPKVYANNTAVLEAVGSGEISVGFINHYYLFRKLDESPDYPAANHFFDNGDVGGLVNVAGAGILKSAQHAEAAQAFIEFVLSEEAQAYFSDETKEYPLLSGVAADPLLPALETLGTPEIDLNALADLQGTLELLQSLGIL